MVFFSVDGMLGREAMVALKNLSLLMTAKMDEPILYVRGWIISQIAIGVARLYSRMTHRARIPRPRRNQDQDWDLTLGLGLAQ